MTEKRDFGDWEQFVVTRGKMKVSLLTLGATVTEIEYNGRVVTLGYPTAEEYRHGSSYMGAIVGRYANRIARARFPLHGREVRLTPNEGENQLHGGPNAFDQRTWTAESAGEDRVRFTLFSPDGDNGFPGALTASVTYTVTEDALRIDFAGVSDRDTVFAPAPHLYFNLDGAEDILGTRLAIFASRYLPVDGEQLPLGTAAAEGAFDFSRPRPIGRDYDHCFLLDGERACRAEAGGIAMEIDTDFPALQLYTGRYLSGRHRPRQGFALEPEFCPDSPNHPAFPSAFLPAGTTFHRYALYRFSAENGGEA